MTMLVGLIILDGWAVHRAIHSSIYSKAQVIGQAAIAILFPVVGALLVLYLARDANPSSSGHYPVENTDAEDVAWIQDYKYGGDE
jgi:uncharacterized iron-regulated membrane protein